jgi:hypothetical protein
MYAVKQAGVWTPFDFKTQLPIVGQEGLFTVPRQWSDEEKETRAGIFVVAVDSVPAGKVVASESVVDDDGRPRLARTFSDIPLGDLKSEKLASLANRRWQAEEGGITIGGVPIKTDRESQTKLTGAYIKAKENPGFVIANWKVTEGVFVTLNAATIVGTGDAVTAHVQACFDREAALTVEVLAAGGAAAVAAIDLDTGWPV